MDEEKSSINEKLNVSEGSINNYVDRFLVFFDPLPNSLIYLCRHSTNHPLNRPVYIVF